VNQLIDTLDADRRRAVENVREATARIWERPLHRHYTDHTVAHSERVIALLDGLTAGMMQGEAPLSTGETFVLLAAAYLHDAGMQNEKFAGGDPLASPGQRLDEIRAHHNEQTAEMIYAVFEDPANAFPIPLARDPGLVEAVALVAKGHRRVDLAGPEYEPLVHGSGTLRLRLLAALLRFGDELDIDHRRVDLELFKLMSLKPDSQLHWYRCYYVSGVSIVDEYIRVVYRFPRDRPDYEGLIVPLVEDEIRAKHAALEEIFRAGGVKVALGPSQVRLMRLVQPLPPEVEALAREQEGKSASGRVSDPGPRSKAEGESANRRMGEGAKGRIKESRPAPLTPAGGDRARITATLDGSGAIAQDHSAAASGGGVAVGGDVGGDVVTGTKVTGVDQRGAHIGQQINVSGDYVDRRAPDAPDRHMPGSAGRPVEPGWNRAAIRSLLTAALDDQGLSDLCFDHFDPVYQGFTASMDRRARIRALLDYCIRHEQVEKLLSLVREHNSYQYARFEGRLKD